MSETITLDSRMLSLADRLAKKRCDSFSHDTYESTAYGKSSYEVHLIGAKSEIAFSLKYGLLVDLKERLEGDSFDFLGVYDGKPASIDVKCSTYRPPWVQVRESKTESDYYVGTYIEDTDAAEVQLLGWASRDRLMDTADLIASPAGDSHRNYRLWEDELEPLPEPEEIAEKGPIKA